MTDAVLEVELLRTYRYETRHVGDRLVARFIDDDGTPLTDWADRLLVRGPTASAAQPATPGTPESQSG